MKNLQNLRDLLETYRPYNWFDMFCHECGAEFIEKEMLTESVFKNEVLLLHLIHTHFQKTGHQEITIDAQEHATMDCVYVTIKVNADV